VGLVLRLEESPHPPGSIFIKSHVPRASTTFGAWRTRKVAYEWQIRRVGVGNFTLNRLDIQCEVSCWDRRPVISRTDIAHAALHRSITVQHLFLMGLKIPKGSDTQRFSFCVCRVHATTKDIPVLLLMAGINIYSSSTCPFCNAIGKSGFNTLYVRVVIVHNLSQWGSLASKPPIS
jgi:hypothetical protein